VIFLEERLYEKEEVLEAYLGTPDKYDWYKHAFDKYEINGVEKFAWNWSWYSFLFGYVYLVYRKCYIEAILLWVAQMIIAGLFGITGIVIMILCGGLLPYLVYKRYKKIALEVENIDGNYIKKLETIKELGGVNIIARNIMIGLFVISIFSILGLMTFLAAVL